MPTLLNGLPAVYCHGASIIFPESVIENFAIQSFSEILCKISQVITGMTRKDKTVFSMLTRYSFSVIRISFKNKSDERQNRCFLGLDTRFDKNTTLNNRPFLQTNSQNGARVYRSVVRWGQGRILIVCIRLT